MKKITIVAIILSLIVLTSCKSREDELKEQIEILTLEALHGSPEDTPSEDSLKNSSEDDMSALGAEMATHFKARTTYILECSAKIDSLNQLLIEEKKRKLRQ